MLPKPPHGPVHSILGGENGLDFVVGADAPGNLAEKCIAEGSQSLRAQKDATMRECVLELFLLSKPPPESVTREKAPRNTERQRKKEIVANGPIGAFVVSNLKKFPNP